MKPKAARFTRLIKLLTASVGPLVTWAWCQAAIWCFQRMQGASERAGLDRIVRVLEVVAELGHPLEGEVGIGVGVELADGLLGLPAAWRRRRVGSPARGGR